MMSRRTTAVLVVVLALALFPALVQASPPDPLWIGGVYDAGDWDDAVLASAFIDGVETAANDLRSPWIAVGTVQSVRAESPASFSFSAFGGRAPPHA